MVKNVRIIKKQANAEILARIIKAASRKYDCSMKIDFNDGNRVAQTFGYNTAKIARHSKAQSCGNRG